MRSITVYGDQGSVPWATVVTVDDFYSPDWLKPYHAFQHFAVLIKAFVIFGTLLARRRFIKLDC